MARGWKKQDIAESKIIHTFLIEQSKTQVSGLFSLLLAVSKLVANPRSK